MQRSPIFIRSWSWKCLRSYMILPTFAKRPTRTGKRSPKTRRYKRRRRASSSAQKRLAQRDVKMYALGSLKLCTACGTVSTQCSSSAFVLNFVDLARHFKVARPCTKAPRPLQEPIPGEQSLAFLADGRAAEMARQAVFRRISNDLQ